MQEIWMGCSSDVLVIIFYFVLCLLFCLVFCSLILFFVGVLFCCVFCLTLVRFVKLMFFRINERDNLSRRKQGDSSHTVIQYVMLLVFIVMSSLVLVIFWNRYK